MSHNATPVIQRRRLRTELRQARLEACVTQEQVAEAMDWSLSKIIRIETGSVGISTNDLVALLRFYRITDSQRVENLVALAKAARQQSWYSKYREQVSSTYLQYIELETSASVIQAYEPHVIPGLLQTEEYATKVMNLCRTYSRTEAVSARAEIQEEVSAMLLEGNDYPALFFVLDEAVIRRLVGDEETKQRQLDRLISAAMKPAVTIEIVPFSKGLHGGMGESFTILEFSDPIDDDILYFESARDTIFSHDSAYELSIYREIFELLRNMSLGPNRK